MIRPNRQERGLTLTEVTIVMVLAAIVTTGLVGFYLNSQATWLDGSLQAISQREANLVLDGIRKRARAAYSATVTISPDAQHCSVALLMHQGDPPEQVYFFWWSASDSLIHEGLVNAGEDRGPMLQSKVDVFRLTASAELLRIVELRVRTAKGQTVSTRTSIRLMNGGS